MDVILEGDQIMERVKRYQVCAWMLYLGDWIENALDRLMAEQHLTLTQARVLRLLAVKPGTTPGEVAKLINRDESTTTGILNRLEKRNLIVRTWSEIDRRQANIKLTDEGRNMYLFFQQELMKLPLFEAMRDLSENELNDVLLFFDRIADSSGLVGFSELIDKISNDLVQSIIDINDNNGELRRD